MSHITKVGLFVCHLVGLKAILEREYILILSDIDVYNDQNQKEQVLFSYH